MSGREKIMVYSYNFKGADARIYGSQSDFRDFMYPVMKGKKPIFTHKTLGLDYGIHKDRIVFKSPVGKQKAVQCYNIHISPFVKKEDKIDARPVQILNLEGEVIAEFKTLRLLVKLTGLPEGTISHQLNNTREKRTKKSGLIFQYKDE